MPAVNLAAILQPAMRDRRAVAGVVVLGWEDALAYVQAAEEVGCPLILQAGPGARAHMPLPVIGPMMRYLADQARVPVAVHLDHGYSFDECIAGLDHGFTSLMFDGSKLPLDENIATTTRLVDAAHRTGVSVEGEVGVVGYADGARSTGTDPNQAARFDRETGVDALAISIGNVHLQTEKSAGIDFELLAKIEAATRSPLVLHGGSGIPVAVRQKLAAGTRVTKFNIGTELRMAFGVALRRSVTEDQSRFDRNALLKPVLGPVRQAAVEVLAALWNPLDADDSSA